MERRTFVAMLTGGIVVAPVCCRGPAGGQGP